MRKGSKGENVERWQAFLSSLHFLGKDGAPIKVDGDFGENTEFATHAFQVKYGLTTGIVDDVTRRFAASLGFKLESEDDETDPGRNMPFVSKWSDWHVEPKPVGITNKEPPFGPACSRILESGSKVMGVEVLWTLELFGYESGFAPLRENKIGARGLWQKLAQRMPDGSYRKYGEKDPCKQIADYFLRTTELRKKLKFTELPTRGHYYCLNLAPARLEGGRATKDTIVYGMAKDPVSYKANYQLALIVDASYTGDVFIDREGFRRRPFFTIEDLDRPLLKASTWFPLRFARELAAIRALV